MAPSSSGLGQMVLIHQTRVRFPLEPHMPFINIIKDKYLRVVFSLSFLFLLFGGAMTYGNLREVAPPFVVHFDIYRGIDFFGGWFEITGVLISAFAMLLTNIFLADFLYKRERFLSYIFGFVSFGLAVLILVATGVIISVN